MKSLIFAAFMAVFFVAQAAASVAYDAATNSLRITGTTTPSQVVQVYNALKKHDVDTVFMDGPGGHFYAGLRLGHQLQSADVRVIIPRGKYCASACALAALGAREVMIDGELMFHTPYTMGVDPAKTIREIAQEHGLAYLDMAEYLVSVGQDIEFAKQIIRNTSACRFIVWGPDGERSSKDFCTS